MSALGQKQTSDWRPLMSALPQKRTSLSTPVMSALCQKQTLRVDSTRGGAAPIVEPDDQVRSYGLGKFPSFSGQYRVGGEQTFDGVAYHA
jgi:hypothetical protein